MAVTGTLHVRSILYNLHYPYVNVIFYNWAVGAQNPLCIWHDAVSKPAHPCKAHLLQCD